MALDATAKSELSLEPNKTRALPANPRTVQGFAGDVTLDEFAWHLRDKAIWQAVMTSITHVGGRAIVCSTPFVPGNLLWQIATNHQGCYSHFETTTITIDDAITTACHCPAALTSCAPLRQRIVATRITPART